MNSFDVLIRGGYIVDGTGRPMFRGDVGLTGDTIVAVEPSLHSPARVTIDALGLIVSPGFIDVHSHDDLAVLHDPHQLPKLLQGVTTTIVGNCGHGVAPIGARSTWQDALRSYTEPVLGRWIGQNETFGYRTVSKYIEALRMTQHSLNVSTLVGHGPLRISTMGFTDAIATRSQISTMQHMLDEGMKAGALGLSLGLMYAPGCFAEQRELIELASVVGHHHGVITSHIRGEGDLLLPSIAEMIDVCREARVPMHISHLKSVGIHNWGRVQMAISLILQARAEGLDVTCDFYPYTAGSTTVLSLLPPWALAGGLPTIIERLRDSGTYQRIRQDIVHPGTDWDNVAHLAGFDRVVLTLAMDEKMKRYEGFTFSEIAERMQCEPVDAYLRVIAEGGGRDTIVIHHMDEKDVRMVLQFPHSVIGSDGLPTLDGHPHPRLYGTFARYLGQYVRDEKLLPVEEAIRKVSKQSADRFGIQRRGAVLPGYFADLVVLDWDQLRDNATYEQPRQFPTGIRDVLVNGKVAVRNGQPTEKLSGQFVMRTR